MYISMNECVCVYKYIYIYIYICIYKLVCMYIYIYVPAKVPNTPYQIKRILEPSVKVGRGVCAKYQKCVLFVIKRFCLFIQMKIFYEFFFFYYFILHFKQYIKVCYAILAKGLKHFHDFFFVLFLFLISNKFLCPTISTQLQNIFLVYNFWKSRIIFIQIFIYSQKI